MAHNQPRVLQIMHVKHHWDSNFFLEFHSNAEGVCIMTIHAVRRICQECFLHRFGKRTKAKQGAYFGSISVCANVVTHHPDSIDDFAHR